jgi:hypothetical protein
MSGRETNRWAARYHGARALFLLFVPQPDSCTARIQQLFDHLVGAGEQCRWQFEAKRLCGLEIDE